MNLPATHPRILLVHADPQVRPVVSRFLKANGFDILEASDGDEASELVQWKRIDLVITSSHTEQMKGEFLTLVRDRLPFVPIIPLPGSSPGILGEVDHPHGHSSLQKALALSELLRVVIQALDAEVTRSFVSR